MNRMSKRAKNRQIHKIANNVLMTILNILISKDDGKELAGDIAEIMNVACDDNVSGINFEADSTIDNICSQLGIETPKSFVGLEDPLTTALNMVKKKSVKHLITVQLPADATKEEILAETARILDQKTPLVVEKSDEEPEVKKCKPSGCGNATICGVKLPENATPEEIVAIIAKSIRDAELN
ncbi:MAG: hypothetical protein DRG78_02830 [Epsilonproteobacteria bacterium]|nr:MAG: hypothetical protein DRG78_02830 [Campylobacterota bacterium]